MGQASQLPPRAWVVTFAGTAVNLCLGILYAWSVWKARLIADTARRIARIRSSPEGREGIAAFLAKRKAAWVPRGE